MLLASSYQIVVVSAPDQSVGTDLERFTVMRKFLLQIVVDGAVVENLTSNGGSVVVLYAVWQINAPANVESGSVWGRFYNQLQVSWSAVEGATSYEVWWSMSDSPDSAVKLTTTSELYYNVGNLPSSTYGSPKYNYFWVKTVSDSGTSAFSEVSSWYGYCPALN